MRIALFAAASAALVASSASASITGAVVVSYEVTAADFGGADVTVNVQDLYMTSNDAADVMLNVYNLTLPQSAAGITYFQSFTGTGWQPNNLGGPFDTAALQQADSFVTIGGFGADGLQVAGAGAGTGLDPNFGGNTANAPGALAGWYNGNPPSLNGATMTYDSGITGVLVGRFAYAGNFDLSGSTLEVTWNQGLGTGANQAQFTVVPAPGAIALLGLAGVAGRRRRG
jgi:hypothetical protein